ncbi:MAG: hypothetical protein JO323_05775 [Acidobacteriia bacterium]|nr:hypothetical protein [Terriglobia bacterium]
MSRIVKCRLVCALLGNKQRHVRIAPGTQADADAFGQLAEEALSGPHGYSLNQLAALPDKAKFSYKLIHREAGQKIPVPSLIHWKVNHYAAVVEQRDGYYVLKDPTFGDSGNTVTAKAIEAESDGYFLVPATVMAANTEAGWRTLSAGSAEAKAVYGMGGVTNHVQNVTGKNDSQKPGCPDKTSPTAPSSNGAQSSVGMTVACAHRMAVSLCLKDTPVGYKPQKGGSMETTVTYTQTDTLQPATFSYSNLGQKWTHTWLSYVQDDPTHAGSTVTRAYSGGGGVNYLTYSTTAGNFDAEVQDDSYTYRIPITGAVTSYEHRMPDGSKEVYALSDGATSFPRKMFLTSVVDPQGNVSTLNYDSSFRITSIVDAMGRSTTFSYALTASPLLITQITDPFGRSAQFTYDTSGRLASITDPIGITSSYTYSTTEPNFVTQLTTPYGNSTFNDTINPNDPPKTDTRSLTLTDPMGYTDYLYYYADLTIVPSTDTAPTGMFVDSTLLNTRNSFEWGKHAWAVCVAAGGCTISGGVPQSQDYSKADIEHWLHWKGNNNYMSGTLGSSKRPLDSRVWTDFAGQVSAMPAERLIAPSLVAAYWTAEPAAKRPSLTTAGASPLFITTASGA